MVPFISTAQFYGLEILDDSICKLVHAYRSKFGLYFLGTYAYDPIA